MVEVGGFGGVAADRHPPPTPTHPPTHNLPLPHRDAPPLYGGPYIKYCPALVALLLLTVQGGRTIARKLRENSYRSIVSIFHILNCLYVPISESLKNCSNVFWQFFLAEKWALFQCAVCIEVVSGSSQVCIRIYNTCNLKCLQALSSFYL